MKKNKSPISGLVGKKSKINGDLWEDAGFSGVHGDRGNDHNGLTIKNNFSIAYFQFHYK